MSGGTHSTPTALLIATVATGGAVALTVLLLADPPSLTGGALRRAIILVVLTALAELIAIPLQHGDTSEKLTLFELAVVADIVLLPASLAAIVSLIGLTLALAVHRKPLSRYLFNFGQYALGVISAIALYHLVGRGDFESTRGLLTLFGGMTLFTAINFLTMSTIIATVTERPIQEVLAEEQGIAFAMGVGNSAVGLVAVSLYLSRPELLPAVLAPTFALREAFKGWVKARELSRQMQDESTKLGRILEHSSEGIVLADASGMVLLWSPSMERITGVTRDEALGKALPYLFRGRNAYGQSLTLEVNDQPEAVEFEIVATDGTQRWLRAQHGPGLDERGNLSFDVLVVTDITRQREVERLKDDFFSTVSHELRTPLTPIKGYASLLLRRSEDISPERRREALQSIVERTDHMARLVEDLLLASRIATGEERRLPEVNRQPVAVGQVTERALRSFRIAHPMREFRLHAPFDLTALGDPIRVEQIVANLVSNAVKFSEEGAPVDVDVREEDGRALIVVRDEGRGIPKDRLEEIFGKFHRLGDPLRMETGGAGLGLFIVQQLVAAMGGRVSVESEPGKGSTFTVALTLAGPEAQPMPQRRDSDLAG